LLDTAWRCEGRAELFRLVALAGLELVQRLVPGMIDEEVET